MADTEMLHKLNTSQGTIMDRLLFWKLPLAKCAGKALMALLLSVVGTLNGAEWYVFTPTQQFVAIVIALGAMWNVIDAFLNDTMARLSAKAENERKSQVAIETGQPKEP